MQQRRLRQLLRLVRPERRSVLLHRRLPQRSCELQRGDRESCEDLATGTDRFVPLDFDYESSYRFGGGYRLCCCGEEIRFLYTRMTSSASDTAVNGDLVPIEASPPPGGTTFIDANVDAKSYDIEWAKTIPLGGCCCSDSCGDSCSMLRQWLLRWLLPAVLPGMGHHLVGRFPLGRRAIGIATTMLKTAPASR